jgi:hypothetical protein
MLLAVGNWLLVLGGRQLAIGKAVVACRQLPYAEFAFKFYSQFYPFHSQ